MLKLGSDPTVMEKATTLVCGENIEADDDSKKSLQLLNNFAIVDLNNMLGVLCLDVLDDLGRIVCLAAIGDVTAYLDG